jgi:hypothetical protein
MGNSENQEEDRPQWMNFICPSCAIGYGINALIKTIKKRKKQMTTTTSID